MADEKTETAVAHRALAWAHVQKGETDRAFEELTDAMRLNSSDPWVKMGLALAAYHSGERGAKVQGLANMMESLHIVVEQFPDFAEAYDMLGWARLTGGGANAAVEALKKAVELSPRDEEYQLRLARAYLAAKKFDEARSTLERLKRSQNPAISQTAKKSLIDLPFLEKYGVPPVEDRTDGHIGEADEAGDLGRGAGLVGPGQQPDGVPAGLLDRVPARPVPLPDLVDRPVPDERDAIHGLPP